MECGGNGDGCSGFMALKYKNTLSNILISFSYSHKELSDIADN